MTDWRRRASIRRQYVGDQLVAEYNVSTGALTKRYIPGLDGVAVTYDGSGTATHDWSRDFWGVFPGL